MSLKKLFNKDYFIQNIKKSKLAVLLFLSLVPIFTSLLIITTGESLVEGGFESLGGFNIFFMYMTPFILSLSLFGYVFNKKSADFMGSMPISRKSVFMTNTLGGILLIVVMQLITLLCTFLLYGVTKAMMFPQLVWEIFIYQTISYIFVFSVCNLAMSVSGNWITQIVVVLLILFVIPASVVFFKFNHLYSYDLMDGEYSYGMHINTHQLFNFTAPSLLINGSYFFNFISIIKMIVLSVIYTILGYYAFTRKKLETAGESFENKNIHFMVKGLTLIPFAMILVFLVDAEAWEGISFLVVIVAVYYLIYDMLTNKKSRFWLNMGAMFASLIMLFGIYRVLYEIGDDTKSKLDINDVKSYSISSIGYTDFYLSDYEFTDINLLKKVLSKSDDERWYKNRITFDLVLKNGTNASLSVWDVEDDAIKELLSIPQTTYLPKNSLVKFRKLALTQKQMQDIIQEVNQYIEQKGMIAFYQDINNSNNRYLTFYTFHHHKVLSMAVPIGLTDHLFEITTQIMNEDTYKMISKNPYREYQMNINSSKYILTKRGETYFYGPAPKELINLVLEEQGKSCNNHMDYVLIQLDGHDYYTNQVEKVAEIIQKYGLEPEYGYYDDSVYNSYAYPTEIVEFEDEEVLADEEMEVLDESENVSEKTLAEPVLESL